MALLSKTACTFCFGTKLILISAVSTLLAVDIIAAQMMSNSTVNEANDIAMRQARVVAVAAEANASVRDMIIGGKDRGLAATGEQMDAARKYLDARHASVAKWIDEASKTSTTKKNIDRLNAAKGLSEQYYAETKEYADITSKVFTGLLPARSPARRPDLKIIV